MVWLTGRVEDCVLGVGEARQTMTAVMAEMVLMRKAHGRAPSGRWARVDAAAAC